MNLSLHTCCVLVLAWAVSGCQSGGYGALADIRRDGSWVVSASPDTALPSVAAVHVGAVGAPVWVYIEGDGRAFLSRGVLSDDPTPNDPVALKLASVPHDATVVYLGRPCQYVMAHGPSCSATLWSTARYSNDVVTALNNVLDRALTDAGGARSQDGVVLVGYSGGGSIAALLAARRSDVKGLITVAANLDTEMWTEHHRVTPLHDSLNPASVAEKIAHVPQVHFIGSRDTIVPESVSKAFMDRLPASAKVTTITEPTFDHHCCWAIEWPRLRKAALQALR